MRRLILATGLATAFAVPAMAAGIVPVPAPAPEPVFAPSYDWSGFSAGLQLGYGDIDTNVDDLDGSGVLYGLRANYDYDFGSFVLGAGVQYDWTDIELELDGDETGIDVDSVLRAGLRAGIDSGRNLFYLAGGWARVELEGGGTDDDSDGFYIGAGYEVFLTDAVTAGAELLYHEFDDFDDDEDLEAEATTFALSVNYRF